MRLNCVRRLVSALLAAVLLCGITGCANSEELSSIEESSGAFEPLPVPVGGWNAESLSKTIRINGKELPEPVTVNGFGGGYSIGEANTLMYNGSLVTTVVFDEESKEQDEQKKAIRAFAVNSADQIDTTKQFYVNGITLGSTADEALKAFGEPAEKTDIWIYYEDGKSAEENYMVLWLDEEEKITWISVRF